MKRLVLLRHGKSDWNAGVADHARPLAARGLRAATTMGALLARSGQHPDRIITSSAVRARTTAEIATEAAGWDSAIEVSDALYMAGPHDVIEVVRGTPDANECLMLVGHEPTWSDVAELLTGAQVRVATATAVGIDLGAGWSAAGPGSGTLAWVLPPRLFGWVDSA